MKHGQPQPQYHRTWSLPRRSEDGLSLVEVMVTLSIIAVATSLVVLTLPRPRPQLQAAGLLRVSLEKAAERSMISGQPVGLVIEERSYSIAVWQNEEWRAVASQKLAPGTSLLVDGDRVYSGDEDAAIKPSIVFDPLGHTEPLDLDLVRNDFVTRLTLHPDGSVTSENPE